MPAAATGKLWAIGDVQGCQAELLELLGKIAFEPGKDRLWFTGDLINRGPRSLATLRFVRELGSSAVTVLGNHDLHLLAVAYGFTDAKSQDTFQDILDAPDRNELLEWLRRQPLAIQDAETGWLMSHAGVPPCWTASEALDRAAEVEEVLGSHDPERLLAKMYGNEPAKWSDELEGLPRWRFIVNAFTRMRYCHPDGRLEFHEKGPPGSQPQPLLPWFEIPDRRNSGEKIVFGHWSALGPAGTGNPAVAALDTGCLWGGSLTALRLDADPADSSAWISVDCAGALEPG